MRFLSGNVIPDYKYSSYRCFDEGEKHVTRICSEDVLLLVFEGTLIFTEDGKNVKVSSGEYYIQEKGVYQSGDEASDKPKYYYVHFLSDFTESDRGYLRIKGRFNIDKIKKHVKNLEAARMSNASPIELHNSFMAILAVLSEGSYKKEDSLSYKINEYVGEKLKEDLTLDKLAHDFGYCKNYIIKIFKREFDLTPHEYITKRRIDVAKNLLISSDMSTLEIAEECGFGTYINFYKAFVNHEKCSPMIFREQRGTK